MNEDGNKPILVGENKGINLVAGKTTVFRQNRAVRFELELTNGTLVEGIIPANTEFKLHLKENDVIRFDIFIDDVPSGPHSII